MTRQLPFTEHEAVLLLDAFLQTILEHVPRKDAIEKCSAMLRKIAAINGLAIEASFRSPTGITSQMARMEYAYYGKTRFTPATKLFMDTVNKYKNNRKEYERLLTEARLMSEGISPSENNLNAIELPDGGSTDNFSETKMTVSTDDEFSSTPPQTIPSVADNNTTEYILPNEIADISIQDLLLGSDLQHDLEYSGFDTIGKLLRMTPADIGSIQGIDDLSCHELQDIIQSLTDQVEAYFSGHTQKLDCDPTEAIAAALDIPEFAAVEDDMKPYTLSSSDKLEQIYAETPLLGNAVIEEDMREQLYEKLQLYVEQYLTAPKKKFSLTEKMCITLAIITLAKGWNSETESSFWSYISSQIGYRDDKSQLRKFFGDCVLVALQLNRRWFIVGKSRYEYKSTIVVHAMTTKRSWMSFYEFLFDFYKTNMNWYYVEDDPILPRMIVELQKRFSHGAELDSEINISAKIYSFQEGIKKLITYRPGYALKMVNQMLKRIDATIHDAAPPPKEYVDILCDQWFEERLRQAQEKMIPGDTVQSTRNVATDYTRIRPIYILSDETTVIISLPDIRLTKTDFDKAVLHVFVGELEVDTQILAFYGNEFGKTLIGTDIDLDICLRRGDGSLQIRLAISCDGETIFDSKDTLYRQILCFAKGKEHDVTSCHQGAYSFFTTQRTTLDFFGAEVSEIPAGKYWNAYFAMLGQGFLIKDGEQILAFDKLSAASSGQMSISYPVAFSGVTFIKNGNICIIITKEENLFIAVPDKADLKKYAIMMNGSRLEWSHIISDLGTNEPRYAIPIYMDTDNACEIQIIDLEKNRLVSREFIKLIPDFSAKFNRDFYLTDEDYQGAFVSITMHDGIKKHTFSKSDAVLSLPVDGGIIEIALPRISLFKDTNEPWPSGYVAWFKEITQTDKIYVHGPKGCSYKLCLGNMQISETPTGCFCFGNTVLAYPEADPIDWLDISLHVSGPHASQDYMIGQLSKQERFLSRVIFDYRDHTLYWNRGMGFVGNKTAPLKLCLETPDGDQEYALHLDDKVAIPAPILPMAEYNYKIVKPAENIFTSNDTILSQGKLFIGDKNEQRFFDSVIQITHIANEADDHLTRVEIKNTYIDNIKYLGTHFIASEDMECPVYQGIMFFMGKNMVHHEFSSIEREEKIGPSLYKVNPVKIIYINETTLSITNEDGDGIYYSRKFHQQAMENHYFVTDKQYTKENKSLYYVADLYKYKKERCR